MRLMAQFDIKSEMAMSTDIQHLKLHAPDNSFVFVIRSMKIDQETGDVTFRCNMEFESISLEKSREEVTELIRRILDMLALITQSDIRFSRLHKIFDWTPNLTMRRGYFFIYDPPKPEPDLVFNEQIFETGNLLLHSNISEKLASALRWFRLGLTGESAEEQFQNFFFALEIIAAIKKPADKVNDKCAKCGNPLFCEACQNHPMHRPYPKQAIEQLCKQIAPDNLDFFPVIDQVRNMMMHGTSSSHIEQKTGIPLNQIVDPLGRVAWNALIRTVLEGLPKNKRPRELQIAMANTYVKWDIEAAAIIETVVPNDSDGNPDIELMTGIRAEFSG